MSEEIRKTPEQWAQEEGTVIMDADGFQENWGTPITRDEYDKGIIYCTIRMNPRMSDPSRELMDYAKRDVESAINLMETIISSRKEKIAHYEMLLRVTKHSKKRQRHLENLELHRELLQDYIGEAEEANLNIFSK
jgi:hypothetical protein